MVLVYGKANIEEIKKVARQIARELKGVEK